MTAWRCCVSSELPKPDKAALLAALEQIDPMVDMIAGIKNKFIAQGFSDETAEALTMDIVGQFLRQAPQVKKGR